MNQSFNIASDATEAALSVFFSGDPVYTNDPVINSFIKEEAFCFEKFVVEKKYYPSLEAMEANDYYFPVSNLSEEQLIEFLQRMVIHKPFMNEFISAVVQGHGV